ncbi:MAG: hypothetical protein ACE5G0_07825 [Rhodothermales bacterium]
MTFRKIILILGVLCALVTPVHAQLNQVFDRLFDEILRDGFALSPGPHGQHFLPAAEEAVHALTPALNSLIAGNVASFPLSSNVAVVEVDFIDGQPVGTRGSLGPIFAESAETLGPGKLVVGFSATHLTLDQLRGVPLKDMRFTFLHQDLAEPGLGDNPNESDIVNIFPDLDVDANIFALYATYGVASNFDVTLAVPFVNITLDGHARATVESFTFGALGQANHHFGDDPTHPELVKELAYGENASGVGNLAVQMKYRVPFGSSFGLGVLADARVPTGNENDFLGTGHFSLRGLLISSWQFGDFTPHLNVGYDYRDAPFDSDELEISLGFDQKLADGLTFAAEILGEFDLDETEAIDLLPGTITLVDQVPNTTARTTRVIHRSNIPDRNRDHTLNAALGLWIAPTQNFQVLANLIVPLQDDGLRSSVVPTVGLSLSF